MAKKPSVYTSRLDILRGLSGHGQHVMLCYILGFNTDAFDYALCAMLAEHGKTIEIPDFDMGRPDMDVYDL